MSDNKITFTFNVTSSSDPQRLGMAIATLIRELTPPEDLPDVAEQIKSQVGEQLTQLRTGEADARASARVEVTAWDKDEELKPLDLRYTASEEPSRFPYVNEDDPNKPGIDDQF
jgi:hypothetical protein